MNKVCTNWCHAVKDPQVAMMNLIHCLNAGHNAWLELRENGDQYYPIMIVNPVLDDPFNWTFSYGSVRNDAEITAHDFLNVTERDLTMHWVNAMGTEKAVEAYKKDGTVMEGLIMGGGISCPVKIEDANRYRRDITGDSYKYDYFANWWKPAEGVPSHIPDPNAGKVFTVCYDNSPVDVKASCERAARYLMDYAATF